MHLKAKKITFWCFIEQCGKGRNRITYCLQICTDFSLCVTLSGIATLLIICPTDYIILPHRLLWEKENKTNLIWSHKNPCFQCNVAITNFLVSHTCEIRFNDFIGQSTVPMYSYSKIPKHGWPWRTLFFNLIRWIQLCDKKIWYSLTVVIKFLLKLSWKALLSSPKARLITFFMTRLIKFYLNN